MKSKMKKLAIAAGLVVMSSIVVAICSFGPAGPFFPPDGCTPTNNCGPACGLTGLGADQSQCYTSMDSCCLCQYRIDKFECGPFHARCTERVVVTTVVYDTICGTTECEGYDAPPIPVNY